MLCPHLDTCVPGGAAHSGPQAPRAVELSASATALLPCAAALSHPRGLGLRLTPRLPPLCPAGRVCSLFTCRPCTGSYGESSGVLSTLCLELLILRLPKPGLPPLGRRPSTRSVERTRQDLPTGRALWIPIFMWTYSFSFCPA